MMKPVIFAFPGNELISESIIHETDGEKGDLVLRHFPDGETYVRVLSPVEGKEAIIICTLHEPDNKFLPLLFLCSLLRDMKVKSICLVAPYLAYMRQDKQFNPGEALSSVYFAKLISSLADRLITVDPHLHRRTSLREIYPVPCEVLHAGELISEWIRKNVPNALLIGPDSESEQWVSAIAKDADAPYIILEKNRLGDRDVEIVVPGLENYMDHTPVLIDDIISTARTMIVTAEHLKRAGMKAPVCIAIHAVFAGNSYDDLKHAGMKQIVTCNTIEHESNGIDISKIILPHIPAV